MGDSACGVRVLLLVAALSDLSLLVLTTMILSILMASGALAPQQGVNGCSTCGTSTDAMGSSSSEEYIEMLRTAIQENIQLLNTSFQSFVNLDQGAEGPRGYNGSVGEEGPVGEPSPMATHSTVPAHLVTEQLQHTSSIYSSQRYSCWSSVWSTQCLLAFCSHPVTLIDLELLHMQLVCWVSFKRRMQ